MKVPKVPEGYREYLEDRRNKKNGTGTAKPKERLMTKDEETSLKKLESERASTLYRSLKGKPNWFLWYIFFDREFMDLRTRSWIQLKKKVGRDDSTEMFQALKPNEEMSEKTRTEIARLFIKHAGEGYLVSAIMFLEHDIAEKALARLAYLYKRKRISESDYKENLIQAIRSKEFSARAFEKLK